MAGAVWAAHELAILLLFFETIERAERTSILTFFNLASAAAMVAGSSLGAVLLSFFGEDPAGYGTVFGISTAGRLACLLLLRRVPEHEIEAEVPVVRTLAARPSVGGIDRPVLASLSQEPEAMRDLPCHSRPRCSSPR